MSTGQAPAQQALPRAFWFLFGGMLVNRLGTFVLPYFAIYLTRSRGLSVGMAGVVVAAYGIGSILSSVCGGVLTDAWGRLRTMELSLVLAAALTALLAFASTLAQLLAVAIALGLTSDLYKPAANATVADLVAETDRVRAYGLLYWAANLGFSASALIGGIIASRSFTALFLLDAATCLLFALVIGYGLRGASLPGRPAAGRRAAPGLTAVLADRAFMAFVLLCVVFWWIYFQNSVAMPATLTHEGLDPAHYGMIIAANGVTVVLLQQPVNKLVRRMALGHAVAAAMVFLGLGFGMFAWSRGLPLFVAAVIVWTIGEIVFSIASPALAAGLAPPRLQGRYQGIFGASASVSLFVGPVAGGFLLTRLGAGPFWNLCLAIGLAAAIGHYLLTRAYTRTAQTRKDVGLAVPVPGVRN